MMPRVRVGRPLGGARGWRGGGARSVPSILPLAGSQGTFALLSASKWARATRKLAGNSPPFEAALPLLRLNRAVARFRKGMPLRGIDFMSESFERCRRAACKPALFKNGRVRHPPSTRFTVLSERLECNLSYWSEQRAPNRCIWPFGSKQAPDDPYRG
jgi:hypothetical protein